VGIVLLQITIAATMIGLGFPSALQVTHVAVGAAVWAAIVIAAVKPKTDPSPSSIPLSSS
jgi:heme A synthase